MSRILDILGTIFDSFKIGRLIVDCTSMTEDRTLAMPDKSGTIATVDDTVAPYLHVQHQEASGVNGGTTGTGGVLVRPLNAVVTNGIAGATLTSNAITLPAGEYRVHGVAVQQNPTAGQLRLQDQANVATLLVGQSVWSPTSGGLASNGLPACISGKITLASETTFYLEHYLATGSTTGDTGFGNAVSSGFGEVYADLEIWKIG